MNYNKLYTALMQSRKSLNRSKSAYDGLELHHIIPKSLGGTNEIDNLVLLTYREHFIAHKLLVKMHSGIEKSKMSYALFLMTVSNAQHQRNISSRDYEYAKRIVSENCSNKNHPSFGRKYDEKFCKEISIRMTGKGNHMYGKKPWNYGKKTKPLSEEHKRKISEGNKNKEITDDFRNLMSSITKGKPKSEEHKRKLSEANKGKKPSKESIEKTASKLRGREAPTFVCPHCNHIGKSSAMKRWHFDNCKSLRFSGH